MAAPAALTTLACVGSTGERTNSHLVCHEPSRVSSPQRLPAHLDHTLGTAASYRTDGRHAWLRDRTDQKPE